LKKKLTFQVIIYDRVIFFYIIDHVTNHRESWAAICKFGDHGIFGRLKKIVFISKIKAAAFQEYLALITL
jgi:hypothetical protein